MILGNSVRGGAGRQNPNLTIGSSGSQHDIKIVNFEIGQPIDHIKAISSMKQNKLLYYQILNRFRNTNILPALNQIKSAIDNENWAKYKATVQSLRTSSGTIGAGMIHYNSYYIQNAYSKLQYNNMVGRYNRLIEDTIDFLEFSYRFLNKNKTESHTIQIKTIDYPNQINLAQGYSLCKLDGSTSPSYLCLSPMQTFEERVNVREGEQVKPEQFDVSTNKFNSSLPVSSSSMINPTRQRLQFNQDGNGIQQIGAIPAAKSSRKKEERKNPAESAAPKIIESTPVNQNNLSIEQQSLQVSHLSSDMSKRYPSGSSECRKAFKGTKFSKPKHIKLSKNNLLINEELQSKYNEDRFRKIEQLEPSSELVIKRRPDLEIKGKEMAVEKANLEPINEKRVQSEYDTQGNNHAKSEKNEGRQQIQQELCFEENKNLTIKSKNSVSSKLSKMSRQSKNLHAPKIEKGNFSQHGILRAGQGASSKNGSVMSQSHHSGRSALSFQNLQNQVNQRNSQNQIPDQNQIKQQYKNQNIQQQKIGRINNKKPISYSQVEYQEPPSVSKSSCEYISLIKNGCHNGINSCEQQCTIF